MIALAERLTNALDLDFPPIGLTFTDIAPDDIPRAAHAVPSACSFWRRAEQGVFYAPAEDHFNCPVGAMVMGFVLPEQVQQQLGDAVGSMCECAYLDQAEAAKIPAVTPAAAGVIYGPLASLPVQPDVILFWLTPSQSMLYNEATGTAKWTAGAMPVTGRPACAAIPTARANGGPSLSLGCAGMRTFTAIGDNYLLAAVPGQEAETFAAALESTVTANETMLASYKGRLAEFESAS